ncbi:hypothetical protein OSB04_015754 [Centaurea solstitialis]|uniref:Knottins-like domain-containing protein n=1 Tax=Centaurea solstitialis TaxID=347529 RepID=A0AA38T191_9ASTR|nr:hypothetical protein OSB04_015754 [Centaurea solstitialis]
MAAIAMWWWRWRWVVGGGFSGGGGGNDAIGLVMRIGGGDDKDDSGSDDDDGYKYMVVGEKTIDKTCERRSKTWTGYCGDSKHCDQQCREWEGAKHGACHREGLGMACFCYFNC